MNHYPIIRPYDAPKRRKQPASTFPAALAASIAAMLVLGLVGCQGTRQDMRDLRNSQLAEDTLTMERVVRVANAEDRAERRLVSDSWLDDLGECNADESCRALVAGVEPRRRR